MTSANPRAIRPYSALVVLTVLLVAMVSVPSPAHAQDPRFGTLFNPAHTPGPETTVDDIVTGLYQTTTIGGHVSYMHNWPAGDEGLRYLDMLVPWFREQGLKVFLQFAPTLMGEPQPPGGLPRSFADPQTRSRYLSDVIHLALLAPDYLNLCAEIDLTALTNPNEIVWFSSLYRDAYTLVKMISPQTQVGVSYHLDAFFAYEEYWLPGFLGVQDYAAFTTYPSWIVHDGLVPSVDAFPKEFYDRVRTIFPTQPVIFSEVGWPSGGRGSRDEQAAFVRELPRLMRDVDPVLVTWTTLSDTNYFELALLNPEQLLSLQFFVDPQSLFDQLNSMGLVDWDGVPKPALTAAQELVFD